MEHTYKSIINERIERYGISTLTDEEALSILIGTPVASLKKHIDTHGLKELINFSETMQLTKSQAKKLQLVYSLSKRIAASTYKSKPILDSSSKAGEFMVQELQFQRNEVFKIALLNARNQLMSCETLFEGTINEAPVYPREIIRMIISYNANAIIVAHNHPAHSLHPSKEDIEVTKKISAAVQTIAVKLIDHIIVAEDRYTSFAEKGLLSFF